LGVNLRVEKTSLDQVLVIHPPASFEDFRGKYFETYNKKAYNQIGIHQEFIQDDFSYSRQNVLRGIHGDSQTWKLVSCVSGSIYLIVVNNDVTSKQFKKWQSFTLSENSCMQILIPPKFGNGHLVMSPTAIFHYKQTTNYEDQMQFTIKFNDPNFNFWWPAKYPITSVRDSNFDINFKS